MPMDAMVTPAEKKVLIVEDEATLAENIGAYFSALGWHALVVGDGYSAIAQCAGFAPDMLVLDYSLPDMSGFEAFDALRKDGCRCDCVMITAHPRETVRDAATLRGIEFILLKPFSLAELGWVVCGVPGGRP